MTTYVPGTDESDHKKQNMSLQQIGPKLDTAIANVATNTASIAVNTSAIAVHTGKLAKFFVVTDYGAVGDGVTDNSTAFASAISALAAVGGGILYVPAGFYLVSSGITVSGNIILSGAGRVATWLYRRTDGTVLTVDSSGQNSAEHLAVMGYGNNALDAIFGETTFLSAPTADAVAMNSSGGFLRDMQIQGGRYTLNMTCTDSLISNVDCSYSYGQHNVNTSGGNWHYHCKWDHGGFISATSTAPYSSWASAHAYSVGNIVANSGFLMICSVAGTSGGSAPALRNYGFAITDGAGTLRWLLLANTTYYGLYIVGSQENHFHQIDLSGSGSYAGSMVIDMTPTGAASIIFESGVCSDVIAINNADWVSISNCEMGSSIAVNTAYTGKCNFVNNWSVLAGALNFAIGANVSGFIIANNQCGGATATVTAGTSDHYKIVNNNQLTVSDGGTGVNKTISGNG